MLLARQLSRVASVNKEVRVSSLGVGVSESYNTHGESDERDEQEDS